MKARFTLLLFFLFAFALYGSAFPFAKSPKPLSCPVDAHGGKRAASRTTHIRNKVVKTKHHDVAQKNSHEQKQAKAPKIKQKNAKEEKVKQPKVKQEKVKTPREPHSISWPNPINKFILNVKYRRHKHSHEASKVML